MSDPANPVSPDLPAVGKANRPKRLLKDATTHPPGAPDLLPDAGSGAFVTLAAIIGAHGVRGEVRLKLFTDDPANLHAYERLEAGGRTLTLKAIRPGPNGAVARFAEVPDRTGAEALRGTELRVARDALPPLDEDEYYHADLIGLACFSPAGEDLGCVVAVENFGAGDVLEIERLDGKRAMAPMTPAAVPEWNRARLIIDPDFLV